MTAFDNIKTNNWPATSNEFEDFLVLKMPLNDSASLTESLPVVAGSQELSPKRTLTNSNVSLEQPQSVVNVKLHTFISGTPGTFTVNGNTVPRGSASDGDVTFTVAVNGGLSSIAWSYDSGNGPYCYMRGIEVDLGDGNGYQLIQDGAFGVSAYSSLISGTVDSTYPLSNLFGGTIGTGYTNGTRHTNPGTLTLNLSSVFPAKKHYDNNAAFGSNKYISIPQDSQFDLGTEPFTLECYVKTSDTSTGYPIIIGRWGSGGDSNFNNIWDWRPRAADNGGRWCFRVPDTSGGASGIIDGGATVTDGAWHHIAVSRSGNTWRMFTDGQLTNTATNSNPIPAIDGPLNLARGYNTFTGSIQDLRFYKGVAKYTSNFTPPGAILG